MIALGHQAGPTFATTTTAISAILLELIALGIDYSQPAAVAGGGMDREYLKGDRAAGAARRHGQPYTCRLGVWPSAGGARQPAPAGAGGGYILAPCHICKPSRRLRTSWRSTNRLR
jgi:hypothetical protein